MTEFPGFSPEDFAVFAIPEFHPRMSAIRTRVRPKLAVLGDEVADLLPRLDGEPFYPHTASHARRRINPPEDTWVAFSRSPRGYKRFAHFEIGIAETLVFVRFIVKAEGTDDKPGLTRYLRKNGVEALHLASGQPLYWYRDDHGTDPMALDELDSHRFNHILEQVQLKTHGFAVGAVFPHHSPTVQSRRLIGAAVELIEQMWPLYTGTVAQEALVAKE